MTVAQQVDRLAEVGIAELAGLSPDAFRRLADGLQGDGIVCVHPTLVRPSLLAPLLRNDGKPGFVVEDMTDLDEFTPIDPVLVPDRPLYMARGVDAGQRISPNCRKAVSIPSSSGVPVTWSATAFTASGAWPMATDTAACSSISRSL